MKHNTNSEICPYCGGKTQIYLSQEDLPYKFHSHSSDQAVLVCKNYPHCKAYSFFDPIHEQYPGVVADKYLRNLRSDTHKFIDILWLTGIINRNEMYKKLSEELNFEQQYCHVRYFGINECVDSVIFAISYIIDNFDRITTFDKITIQQRKIIIKVIQSESCLMSNDITEKSLKLILELLPTINNIKIIYVNKRNKNCLFKREGETISIHPKAKSQKQYIRAIYNELYTLWKEKESRSRYFTWKN